MTPIINSTLTQIEPENFFTLLDICNDLIKFEDLYYNFYKADLTLNQKEFQILTLDFIQFCQQTNRNPDRFNIKVLISLTKSMSLISNHFTEKFKDQHPNLIAIHTINIKKMQSIINEFLEIE